MRYASVALHRPIRKTFQYRIPDDMEWQVGIGALVAVTFSKRDTVGCVTGLSDTPEAGLKEKDILPIHRVINPRYLIPEEIIHLCEWISDYYCCGIGESLHCASMIGFHEIVQRKLRLIGLLEPEVWRQRRQAALENPDAPPEEWKKLTTRRRRLIEAMLDAGEQPLQRQDILERFHAGPSMVNRLLADGIFQETEMSDDAPGVSGGLEGSDQSDRSDASDRSEGETTPEVPLTLNHFQTAAFETIRDALDLHEFRGFLLYGVTGSGKTEVYLQAIARALELGRQAICLVPEIALTPQTVERFRARFGDRVGVYHSQLTIPKKFALWRAIESGEISILVGARSALFAPFKDLGLIIVDEEHETSYKQSDPAPRYHARDVAMVRGRNRKAVVILGSATPSLESYYNCELGKYTLLKLPHRVSQLPMSTTRLVDMREEVALRRNPSLFSQPLRDAIAERLKKHEQVLLFLNRRGFSSFQMCAICRAIPQCPRCDVSLTYHKGLVKMVCHYCDRAVAPYPKCPKCGSDQMEMVGMGTERVEETIQEEFPNARVIRLDLDTTGARGAFEQAWRKICNHEADIIVGTQIIAKGLHIENITLAGVISADYPLFQPDFRAAERAFSLLTQVTGRSGRGEKPGETIIQTYHPKHYSIQHATRQDYEGFYQQEIKARALMRFPPHQRLIALLVSDLDHAKAFASARALSSELKKHAQRYRAEGITVLGATPAPIGKMRGRYRFLTLVRGSKATAVRAVLDAALKDWKIAVKPTDYARATLTIDVDPVDLL